MARVNDTAAPNAIAVLRYDVARAAKQWRTSVIAAIFSAAVVGASIYFAIWFLAVFFGIVLLIVVGVGVLLRSQGGAVYVTLTPEGLWVATLERLVTWSELSYVSAWLSDNAVHTRSSAGATTAAFLARGSINDGKKIINLVLNNPLLLKEQLGSKLSYRVSDSLENEQPSSGGVAIDLSAVASTVDFTAFVHAVGDEALRHNIAVRWNW